MDSDNKQTIANHKIIPQPTQLMEPKRLKFPNIILPKAMQHIKRLPATRENPEEHCRYQFDKYVR